MNNQLEYNATLYDNRFRRYKQEQENILTLRQLEQQESEKYSAIERELFASETKSVFSSKYSFNRHLVLLQEDERVSSCVDTVYSIQEIDTHVIDMISSVVTEMNTKLLVTYQELMTSEQLLTILIHLYNESSSEEKIKINVVTVLTEWMKSLYIRFESFECQGASVQYTIVNRIQQFIDYQYSHTDISSELVQRLSVLKKSIAETIARRESYSAYTPLELLNLSTSNALSTDSIDLLDPTIVALHITLLDFYEFSKIEPQEFLNLHWSKPKYRIRAPNILRFIKRFNGMSLWFSSLVVAPLQVYQRTHRIEWLIHLAEQLWKLNNFNAIQALVGMLVNQLNSSY
jgi:hypothetical protein